MTDQPPSNGAPPPDGAPTAAPEAATGPRSGQSQVPFTVLAQYVKDLSFENPRAPAVFSGQAAPQTSATVTVQVQPMAERTFEVVLNMHLTGTVAGESAYLVEVAYGGVFAIGNVADEMIEPILMVEAPRLLFPFARGVAAMATREGGFPQVLINPIDFAALYRNHRRQRSQAQQAASA
jgi:preprotein translocase subunit SecB